MLQDSLKELTVELRKIVTRSFHRLKNRLNYKNVYTFLLGVHCFMKKCIIKQLSSREGQNSRANVIEDKPKGWA